MKAKKLLALGLLSAMAVTTMSATGVSAAYEGTGATNVEYTPGRSSGGDGEGNVSSWTIDYPVKITLSDATVVATDGSGEFATLSKNTLNHTLKAYLKDNTGAENKKTYNTTLTWVFESDN